MKNVKKYPLTGLLVAVCTTLGAGCGTLSIPQYAGGPAKAGQVREAQGLVVCADPFVDKERTETYFKLHPFEDGVAIIHLRAENRSPDATWLLNEENMLLVDTASLANMNAHDRGVKGDYGAANAVGMTGALLISPVMIFAAGKLTSDAMIKEKNFVDKEWRNQTLSPGQSAAGFVYFNFGGKTNWVQGKSLQINSLNVRTQQTNTFIIPLAYENK